VPSFAGNNFISLRGHRDPGDMQIEDVSRPGVNGAEFRQVQKRGEPFEMEGVVDCTSLANAVALFKTIHALRGTIVSIVDDYGDTFNAVVHEVVRLRVKALAKAAGGVSGNPQALLALRFRLQEP
jgi:hypothetical protein